MYGVAVGACRHECPGEDEAIRQGVHYFYVDNRLDEDIVLEFNTLAFDNKELSGEYQINQYLQVRAFKDAVSLVRVYDKSLYRISLEALNCFYYSVLFSSQPRYTCVVNYKGRLSPSIWSGAYWRYEQLNKWEAVYTLVIDEASMEELFFPGVV